MDHRFSSCNFGSKNGCNDSNAGYGQNPGEFSGRPATFINLGSEYSFTFNGPGTYNINVPGVDVGFPFHQHQNTTFPTTQPWTVNVNSGPYAQYNYNQFDPMYVPPPIKPRIKSGESREAVIQRGCTFKPIIPKQTKKRSGSPYPYLSPSDKDPCSNSCSNSCSIKCSSSSSLSDLSPLSDRTGCTNNSHLIHIK